MLPHSGSVVRALPAPVLLFVLLTSGCAATPATTTRTQQDRPVREFCATVLVGEDIRAAAWRAARDGLVVYVTDDVCGSRLLRADDPHAPWKPTSAKPRWFSLDVGVAERPFTTLALSCCAKADQSARIASVNRCSST
ncbi:MAG TPA: hypothetical protein VFV33_13380 [Gemmatimonadaceae bacterium]|nr:hypothetical protein [Gemmatimonadaceae bacterium]